MTPAEPEAPGRNRLRYAHLAGWMDLLGTAMSATAPRVQRVHFQIADTVFAQLDLLPPAQPVVRLTRLLHHHIAALTYTSVRYSGVGVSCLARQHPAFARSSRGWQKAGHRDTGEAGS